MATANVDGRKIYYEWHGTESPEHPPLVLVMGMAGSCSGWLPIHVPAYGADRRVLIFDHRGVGESEDDGKPFTTEDLARDAIGLLDGLGVERFDVLGPFMGGMVAQHMCLMAPERAAHAVLVGTYARPDAKRRMILDDWATLAEQGASYEALLRQRLLWTAMDETLEQTDLIATMLETFHLKNAPVSNEIFIRQCRACLSHDTTDRLGEIQAPTLLVCGRWDNLTPTRLHRVLAEGIPDTRLVTMSYGGHIVMVEAAERFNQIVLQFLDD